MYWNITAGSWNRSEEMGRCSIWTENGLVWLLFHSWVMHTVVTMWSKWQASWGIQELGYHSNQSIMDTLFGWKITGFGWRIGDKVVRRIAAWVQFIVSGRVGCAEALDANGWAGSAWKGQAPNVRSVVDQLLDGIGIPLYGNSNRIQANNLQLYSRITRCW